ncbi:TPA: DNA polymerase III subunit delta', partial [Campylobacter jejuni]|nr:DNA polymerase III subunit delta' [Campylobacter jejuni]EAL6301021.1 DNA polymerase III subunit delta' [Campylobacter jejuni]HEG8166236.1 DNA polymerase III subunit delta' [Campylobacter jejuni]
MFISKIIISEDFLGIKEEMINNFGIKKLRFFMPQNEFLLDDARAVEKESYIA